MATKKQVRDREHSALERATLAEMAARKALRAARKAGDAAGVELAGGQLAAASAEIAAVHRRRFEKNATMRGATALNAIAELAKLVRQQRYAVTADHARAITAPLSDALAELVDALNEATRRGGGPAARGITFGTAVGPTGAGESVCGYVNMERR